MGRRLMGYPIGLLDLTIAGLAPTPLEYFSRPAAFLGGETVHLPYRGSDHHVYEIVHQTL